MSALILRRLAAGLACLLSVAGATLSAAAEPANLFEPAGAADIAAAPAADAPFIAARQRLVRLDPAALANLLDGTSDDNSRTLRIELFPDTVATFRRATVEPAYGGGSIWTGDRVGGDGAATLVVQGRRITGHIDLDGRIFRIDAVGGVLHRVVEIRPDRLRPEGPSARPPLTQERSTRFAEADRKADAPKGKTTVDVLFAYTSRSASASSNIRREINLAVSLANKAYEASSVKMRLRLVGTIAVGGYDETSKTYQEVLSDLTGSGSGSTPGGRAAFADTRALRDDAGADLVVLIREEGEYCGLAWVNEDMTAKSAEYGYSEVSRDCLSTYTAAHEMGHNMGLNHDRYVEDPAPKSHYNFGFVNVDDAVQDIMAYDNRCVASGVTCRQLNRFSNPRKKVKGDRFGIPKGKKGAADAARWLNEVRGDVAAFRPTRTAEDAAADTVAAAPE